MKSLGGKCFFSPPIIMRIFSSFLETWLQTWTDPPRAAAKLNGCKTAPQVLHILQPCTKSLLIEQKLSYLRNTLFQSEKYSLQNREIWFMEPEKYVHRIKVEWLQSAPQVLHILQPCTKSLLIEQKVSYLRNTLLQYEKCTFTIWEIQFTKQRNMVRGTKEIFIIKVE